MTKVLALTSGTPLRLLDPSVPGLHGRYWVLHAQGRCLDPSEREELLGHALRLARSMALEHFGDPEAYSLLLNGESTRRTSGDHVHIVLSRSLAEKRRGFLFMQSKHFTRRLRDTLRRPLRLLAVS